MKVKPENLKPGDVIIFEHWGKKETIGVVCDDYHNIAMPIEGGITSVHYNKDKEVEFKYNMLDPDLRSLVKWLEGQKYRLTNTASQEKGVHQLTIYRVVNGISEFYRYETPSFEEAVAKAKEGK